MVDTPMSQALITWPKRKQEKEKKKKIFKSSNKTQMCQIIRTIKFWKFAFFPASETRIYCSTVELQQAACPVLIFISFCSEILRQPHNTAQAGLELLTLPDPVCVQDSWMAGCAPCLNKTLIMSSINYVSLGAGEMAQSWRAPATLPRTQVQFQQPPSRS